MKSEMSAPTIEQAFDLPKIKWEKDQLRVKKFQKGHSNI